MTEARESQRDVWTEGLRVIAEARHVEFARAVASGMLRRFPDDVSTNDLVKYERAFREITVVTRVELARTTAAAALGLRPPRPTPDRFPHRDGPGNAATDVEHRNVWRGGLAAISRARSVEFARAVAAAMFDARPDDVSSAEFVRYSVALIAIRHAPTVAAARSHAATALGPVSAPLPTVAPPKGAERAALRLVGTDAVGRRPQGESRPGPWEAPVASPPLPASRTSPAL